MQPHGADRLRVTEDGRIVLASPFDKGWTARVAKTLTTPEHPGTAVLCDGEYYEVVEASVQPAGGIRYVLAPWRDEHAIRVTGRYDAESEAARVAEHAAARKRDQQAGAASILCVFAGHLPAIVQERMGSELGMLPARMSLLSLLLPMGFVAWAVYSQVSALMGGQGISLVTILVAAVLFAESAFRFLIVFAQSRPCGSMIGSAVYLAAYTFGPRARMTSPFAATKGMALYTIAPEEDQLLRDELVMKAAYATLLTPAEQRRLEARFDFDHRQHAYGITAVLLIAGLLGAISAIGTLRHGGGFTAVLALLTGGALALEQVVRLAALRRGPAGSVLAFCVRPLMKRLLQA